MKSEVRHSWLRSVSVKRENETDKRNMDERNKTGILRRTLLGIGDRGRICRIR